ncbi:MULTISPECIES: hypothetical protein [unclassified Desulfovibrio]|uniref:hypothetical protein n=1 Tax=unclassified Desulfovibrio TaxID=2593640 RepID=UPI002FDAFA17
MRLAKSGFYEKIWYSGEDHGSARISALSAASCQKNAGLAAFSQCEFCRKIHTGQLHLAGPKTSPAERTGIKTVTAPLP